MKKFINKKFIKLQETLYGGDLDNMIEADISIDEYEPKVDDDAVVIAFYSENEEAAYDLSRFLEFGPHAVLDTEVSPVPDEDGRYLIFIEIERENFPEQVIDLLKTAKKLTLNDEYKWTAYGREGPTSIKV